MPNIAITNFCNLTCPYCFADDMVKETKKNISLEQYHYILQWISKTPENHIGIIGGEPCTHPFFSDIIVSIAPGVNMWENACKSSKMGL